jgi:hypothetical protein
MWGLYESDWGAGERYEWRWVVMKWVAVVLVVVLAVLGSGLRVRGGGKKVRFDENVKGVERSVGVQGVGKKEVGAGRADDGPDVKDMCTLQ